MTLPPSAGRAHPAGFTLAELLVVLAIMGVVSAVALRQDWSGTLAAPRLDAVAHRLASDLRRARAEAMAEGSAAGISVDVAGHRYLRWPQRAEQAIPEDIGVQVRVGADARRVLSAVVDIGFGPDGGASGAEISLTAGAGRRLVRLDWLTGRVDVAP